MNLIEDSKLLSIEIFIQKVSYHDTKIDSVNAGIELHMVSVDRLPRSGSVTFRNSPNLVRQRASRHVYFQS